MNENDIRVIECFNGTAFGVHKDGRTTVSYFTPCLLEDAIENNEVEWENEYAIV
jgi:hypothetical protein